MNENALKLADAGFTVFPILPDSKIPPKGFKWKDRTLTKKQIKKLKNEYNWAIRLEGLTVVDIDTKNADGFKSFKDATGIDANSIDTYKVKTPSGGLHLYFKGETEQTLSSIPSVDIKSRGGYVLAPHSEIRGKKYIDISGPILPLPRWIDKLKRKRSEIKVENEVEGVKVYESGRNNAVTSYTGTLWQAGTSLSGLQDEVHRFNEEQCEPPLPQREVDTIIKSITKHRRDVSRLYASALNDFRVSNSDKFSLLRASKIDFETIKPTPWVLDRRYAKGFMSFLAASGGSGKSLLQILDAISAASGKPVSGADIQKRCNVWLHNCEDDMNMLMQRLQAAIVKHEISQEELDGLYISSGRDFKILLAESVRDQCVINKEAVKLVKQTIKRKRIELWLVDPLIHMHNLNENDNAHMNTLCSIFTDIADSTGCAIGIAHHVAKSSGAARGASAIIDASRIAYSLDLDKKAQTIDLSVIKNNLSPSTEKRTYKMVSVDFIKTNYPTLIEVTEKMILKPEKLDKYIDEIRGRKRCITVDTFESALAKKYDIENCDIENSLAASKKYALRFSEHLTPLIRPINQEKRQRKNRKRKLRN